MKAEMIPTPAEQAENYAKEVESDDIRDLSLDELAVVHGGFFKKAYRY